MNESRWFHGARRRRRKNPVAFDELYTVDIVTKFYDRVIRIEAQKGGDSHFPKDKFYHDFKIRDAEVFGLADGSVLIRSASGKKLWDTFEYD